MVHEIFSKSFLAALVLGSGLAAAEDTQVSLSRPAEQRPGCLADSMRVPRAMLGHLPDSTTLEFTVSADGEIWGVSSDAHVGRGLDVQFRAALSRCAWTPAADLSGVPITRRVRVPIRFEANEETGTVVARVGELEPVVLAAR
jgi:hypothetical protein